MAFTRPSGIPVVDYEQALVFQEVTQIDRRGRINLLPRWTRRIEWLSNDPIEAPALMVLEEPGHISIRSWEKDGQRVEQRYLELASQEDDASLEALRFIQDRYQKLIIPAKKRCSLGQPALAHLGFPVRPQDERPLYVAVYPSKIDLMSPNCRDRLLLAGHPYLDDLP